MKKFLKKTAVIAVIIAVIIAASHVWVSLNPTVSPEFTISRATDNAFYLTAHRGLSSVAPENSAPALIEAGKAGYYSAEFDVRPTSDGVWIMMHDSELDRTTNGTGNVEDFTYEELLGLNIDSGNGIENYPDLKISTLEQAIDICIEYSMRPMIEIKGGSPEDMQSVLDIIRSKGVEEQALVIDFDEERLLRMRELDKDIELWYLVSTMKKEDIALAKEKDFALAFNYGKIGNYFRLGDAKSNGITLACWTVDLLPTADFLNLIGIDYITTNRITP